MKKPANAPVLALIPLVPAGAEDEVVVGLTALHRLYSPPDRFLGRRPTRSSPRYAQRLQGYGRHLRALVSRTGTRGRSADRRASAHPDSRRVRPDDRMPGQPDRSEALRLIRNRAYSRGSCVR